MGPGEETRSQTTAEYIEPGLKWEPMKGEKRVHSGLAFYEPSPPVFAHPNTQAAGPDRPPKLNRQVPVISWSWLRTPDRTSLQP